MGHVMMKTGAYSQLSVMSREEGRKMDNPESVKVRPPFCAVLLNLPGLHWHLED